MLKTRPEAAIAAMLVAAGMLPLSTKADTTFTEGVKHRIYTLHTHLASHPLDLSPQISSTNKEYKTAAVCFINDTSACADGMFGGGTSSDIPSFDLNPDERCYNEGYTVSDCPDGYKAGGKKCPYGPYYSECVASCPSDYVTCEEPNVGVGKPCDGKYASCTCTPCGAGYDYTSVPSGYVQDGESCLDCDGQTKYKVKVNPCDGFMDCGSMGGEAGAATCLSGTITKYDNCKPCPNLGTYTSCPSSSVCEYEDCSGLWYATGCKSGYTDYCDYCAM